MKHNQTDHVFVYSIQYTVYINIYSTMRLMYYVEGDVKDVNNRFESHHFTCCTWSCDVYVTICIENTHVVLESGWDKKINENMWREVKRRANILAEE